MNVPSPRRRTLLLGLGTSALHPQAFAAEPIYPVRPITLVVPFPPGGQTDVIGRLVGERLAHHLGQPVMVENRPGVNGSRASDAVARAHPDGYTLVVGGPGTHAINPLVNPNVRYDPRKDFSHIALLSRVPVLMLASPTLQAQSVAEVVVMAKARPDSLNVALTGIGSSGHMTTELFKLAAGVSLNGVPYKGDMPAMTDLIGGQADLLFVPATAALGFAQAGKLKVLAVAGHHRLAALPQVPTMAEAGQQKVINHSWVSLAGPAGMSADLVGRLNRACRAVLVEPEVSSRLAALSNETTPGSPEQAAAFVTAEMTRWSEVVKVANIRMS
ncbi:MAG: hypothetical protein RL223_904 [Pseudomonadota bacterium]|jgi:tripartite-type tricarboxylate transporter receptor subunit TctC